MDKNEEIKSRLCAYVDKRSDEIIKLCSDIVKIPTENPPGDMSQIAPYIKGWLEERGIMVDSYEPKKGKISLVARIGEAEKPVLILNGHMDVVPAGDLPRWDFPPYSGIIRDGRILGRGSTDMKGGLASILVAFTAVSTLFQELPGTLILVAVPDEETGGHYGTEWLLRTGVIKGDACLIAEPSSLHTCVIGEKGLCWFQLNSKGIPAHGSLPMLGENAIEKMMKAFSAIKKIEGEEVKIPADILGVIEASKIFLKRKIGEMGVTNESKLKVVMNALDHSTVNLGIVHGGTKINVVPDSCFAEVDIRIPLGVSSDKIRDQVEALLKDADLGDVECELLLKTDPNRTSMSEKIYLCLSRNAWKVLGSGIVPIISTGASEAFFMRREGIPTIDYGPGDEALCHAYNEYLLIEDLIKATKLVGCTIIDYVIS